MSEYVKALPGSVFLISYENVFVVEVVVSPMKNAHSVVSVDTSWILGKTVWGGPIIWTLLYADSDPNVQYKYPFTVSVTFVPSVNASLLATLLDNSSYNPLF